MFQDNTPNIIMGIWLVIVFYLHFYTFYILHIRKMPTPMSFIIQILKNII